MTFLLRFLASSHTLSPVRKVCFIGNIGECLWFITHYEIKWGFSSGGVGSDIMDKFSHGYMFGPFGGILSAEYLEVSLDFLVDPLCFSISLGVVCG